MPNKKELIEKLQKIQQILHTTEAPGRGHLESLGEELMKSFDTAIRSIDQRVNARHEARVHRAVHRKWRRSFVRSLKPIGEAIRNILSMPFVYALIIPVVILHLFLEVYQRVAFRLYRIPRVRARDYFVFDRAQLSSLYWVEKLSCLYCSYANSLFQYAVEIGGRTERYWCPIKHANHMKRSHSQYEMFMDYLEADTMREKWAKLRDFSDLKDDHKV